MDNEARAPVIPAGTEPTVYGTPSYILQDSGQANNSPDMGKSADLSQHTSEPTAPLGTTYDELVAKKGFGSPEDLAKAYMELESHNKRVEMGVAELAKIKGETESVKESTPTVVETQQDAIRVVEQLVAKQVGPLREKLALQDLFHNNADAPQFAGRMAELVKENPSISWDLAYKVAKFDTLEKNAKEQGKKEAYQAIAQKQAVTSTTTTPSSKGDTRNLEELIADKSIPFTELKKIMRSKFSQ